MKFENNVFEDLMGIVIETDDAFLNKTLNKNICYKGGGSSTTVNQPIPPQFIPYYTKALEAASTGYDTGELSFVAQTPEELRQAQAMGKAGAAVQGDLSTAATSGLSALSQAAKGEGPFGAIDVSAKYADAAQQARKALAGSQMGSAARGTLGSARDALRSGEIEANLGRQIGAGLVDEQVRQQQQMVSAAQQAVSGTQAAQQAAMAPAATMRDIGKELMAEQQRLGDREYQALSRYSQLLGQQQAAMPTTSTTTQSGGK